ncbi:hypothetical protein GGI35DRAFT_482113 [Trichoderma velutinum]
MQAAGTSTVLAGHGTSYSTNEALRARSLQSAAACQIFAEAKPGTRRQNACAGEDDGSRLEMKWPPQHATRGDRYEYAKPFGIFTLSHAHAHTHAQHFNFVNHFSDDQLNATIYYIFLILQPHAPPSKMIAASSEPCNFGRGAYDTTGLPKPPPPQPQ